MALSRIAAALALLLGASETSAAAEPRDMAGALRGRLVRLEEGRLVATQPPRRARFYTFYFGASWCGPCRAFVPELKRAYPRLAAAGVEIAFVSDDSSCSGMRDYIASARMPWPAVACRHRDRLAWLQRARGAALPGILVYDAKGERVITSWSRSGHSSPRKALAELQALAASP